MTRASAKPAASTTDDHREASRRRVPRATLAMGLLLLFSSACSTLPGKSAKPEDSADAPQAAAKTLRVGVAPVYPPLIFKRGTQLVGVEVDFAKALGSEIHREVSFVELEWNDLIPALRDRRIDVIMSGMTVTDARKQQVTFAHPYLRVGEMALIRRKDAARLRPAGALNSKSVRVGYIAGTTGESFVRNQLNRAQRQSFDSIDAGVSAVRGGDVDAFLADSPAVWRITGGVDGPEHQLTGIYEPMTEEYLAWAVRKEDSGLRELLDTVLQQWHTSGKLDQMLKPWIRVRAQPAAKKKK